MPATQLSDDEVRQRLSLCDGNLEVVDELYDFGKTLSNEVIDRIRAVESKATSFAAYGAAIVTFLVASIAIWSKPENQCSSWIAVSAGFCGLMCTYFSLQVLALREYEWISEDEWLKTECLTGINSLKQYRILTMWGTIHSHSKVQSKKARELQRAEVWLTGSVVYLVLLLFHVAFLSFKSNLWISVWQPIVQRMIQRHLWIPSWQNCTNFGLWSWGCFLILALIMGWISWRVWVVRLI